MHASVAALVLALLAPCANAAEKVAFEIASPFEKQAAVRGELRVPPAKRPVPAVLILHGSAGVDGRGAFYAEAFHEAGFATLEIDMFARGGRPATTLHNLPHAYESLKFLARDPRIDARRIGVMGFSWGGILSLVTSSEELTQRFAGARPRFAAHLGLYPACAANRTIVTGTANFPKTTYARVTGAPVRILAAEKDDYDDPDSCERFLADLAPEVRSHFELTVYPGATHIWDGRSGGAFYDSAAFKGKGGIVKVEANPELARRSRETAVAFFRTHLGPED